MNCRLEADGSKTKFSIVCWDLAEGAPCKTVRPVHRGERTPDVALIRIDTITYLINPIITLDTMAARD